MIDRYSVQPIDITPLGMCGPGHYGWAPVEEGKHTHWGVLHDKFGYLRFFSEDQAAARLKADALNERSNSNAPTDLCRHRQSQDATRDPPADDQHC